MTFKILVVEDEITLLKSVCAYLENENYKTQRATNGRSALQLFRDFEPDLVILDIMLPGTNGLDVCKAVKSDPQTSNIPIIMLTSKSSPFDKVKGKLAGCDSYLTKPVEHEEFQKVVAGYLK